MAPSYNWYLSPGSWNLLPVVERSEFFGNTFFQQIGNRKTFEFLYVSRYRIMHLSLRVLIISPVLYVLAWHAHLPPELWMRLRLFGTGWMLCKKFVPCALCLSVTSVRNLDIKSLSFILTLERKDIIMYYKIFIIPWQGFETGSEFS